MTDAEHRAAKSGISGQIVPESEAQQVIVSLADGQIRRIYITHDEASRILRYGRNLSPWWRRLVFGMRAPSAVLVVAVIAGLVLPALTKQWSDRQREFDVKEALIQKVNSAVDSSVWLSRSIARGGLAIVRRRNYACTPPRGTRNSKACAAAREATAIIQSTRLAQGEDQLRRQATRVAADIQLYFPNAQLSRRDLSSPLSTQWRQYILAILAYQELASDICNANDTGHAARRQEFSTLAHWFDSTLLGQSIAPALSLANYKILASWPGCHYRDLYQLDKSGPFVKAYAEIGDHLLLADAQMATPLIKANGRGFSDTPLDFAGDVGLPTLAFLVLALLWTVVLYFFRAITYWPRTLDDDASDLSTDSDEPERTDRERGGARK